ncbi:MAG: succinate dehydrogenase assembly factor 2 [Candidatus Pelagibacter sp.]|nr:MAG: succinate dehydrogenase assembly factor 2 [Candidatus Pelagibacter sp.]
MSLDIDELKKKIIYRSGYRGTKEMDILLSSFVKDVINHLDNDELENLFNLLNIDDDNLYKFKQGIKTEAQINENRISKMFKDYIYKK